MAALMTVVVTKTSGPPATYTILPVTIVAFERQFGTGIGSLATDTRMEYIYWLAWHAEKTSGAIVKLFDDWLNDVESVEAVDDAAPLASPGVTPAK